MLFSIIIPTCNYAHYLTRAMDSVRNQTYCRHELIVVDDGSTDHTRDLIAEYRALHNMPLSYRYQDNRGPSAARNTGVEIARGDCLVFLDADDELLPGALAAFYLAFKNNPECRLAIGSDERVTLDGSKKLNTPGQLSRSCKVNFVRYLRKGIGFGTGAAAIRRDVFEKVRFPESIRNKEDTVFFAQLFALFPCSSMADTVLRIHRHPDSQRYRQLDHADTVGAATDALFEPALLPPALLRYRNEFLSLRLLSIFRSLYLGGDCTNARKTYWRAISIYPVHLLRLSYLRKYLRCRSPGFIVRG